MALLNSSQKAPLTLFEHEAREFEWTDRDLVALAHLQRVTGVGVLRATVIGGKRVLQATHYIGVFHFDQIIVQVLPKIYQLHMAELRPDQEQEAMRNLLFLLHYAFVMQTDIILPFITADASGPKHLTMTLTRSKLEQLVEHLIERSRSPVIIYNQLFSSGVADTS